MLVKIQSKFELKRICKALKMIPKARFDPPTEEDYGYADDIHAEEIGSQKVTVIRKDDEDCGLSTIVLRGSTHN